MVTQDKEYVGLCVLVPNVNMLTGHKSRAIHDTSKHPGQPSKWEPTKNKS